MNSSSTTTTNTKRPYFLEGDDGLASLAEIEAGFSGSNNNHNQSHPLVSRPLYHTALHGKRSSSLRNLASLHAMSSPRSATARFYFEEQQQQQPHFLDACFLCKKPIGDKDIFMYRGDTPFCSEECRQEHIEMDEAKEKSWNLSASMKALRNKDQRKSTSPNKTTQDCTFCTSTIAAA